MTAETQSLQDGIDQAGSPIALLWHAEEPPPWRPPVVPLETVGWGDEQSAGFQTAALSNLSHHMHDLFIKGPDATKLLSDYTANNYENFAVGQAKQIVPVTERGLLVLDGIVERIAEDHYSVTGQPPAPDWIRYHGQRGDYKVDLSDDPSSDHRSGDPVLFRYQLQGPNSPEIIERAFGQPIPETKFFHTTDVTLGGRHFRALRHGMTAQEGYEFIGDFKDGAFVHDALVKAGDGLELIEVGGLAYATNTVESGWFPCPMPAIYTDADLEAYRRSLPLFSWEGQWPLTGSFFSEDIEDYYVSPYEIGYGRSIAFNHDFLGRDALERAKAVGASRTKVTLELELNDADVRDAFGDPSYIQDVGWYRIEADGKLVGVGVGGVIVPRLDKILWLSMIENDYAQPGTQVEFIHGHHPGPGTAPDADLGFARLRATVQQAPYNAYARTGYRDRVAGS